MVNKIETLDVNSLTNSVIMGMDKAFRQAGVPFQGERHMEFRPTVEAIVASVLADHVADLTVEETREER